MAQETELTLSMNHFTEKQLEEGDRQYTEAKDRAYERAQLKSIEHRSNIIKAVNLLGGRYCDRFISLPCGRSLHPAVPRREVWELAFNFEVSLPADTAPEVLAARIRKLLVRHDEFLLTTSTKRAKFSTKQH